MDYVGNELDLFNDATNWKSYWSSTIRKYISGNVLEVGAGIGGNIDVLVPTAETYTALEPDGSMTARIDHDGVEVITGISSDLGERKFDTVLYIDVLEHIEDDKGEFERACGLLAPGGHLIILCPAHQSLYTPFDKAIGHFKRYSKKDFKALPAQAKGLSLQKTYYLDSVGIAASMANKYILRSGMPTTKQVKFWDSTIVPLSRISDKLTLGMLGKTVVGIWQKNA